MFFPRGGRERTHAPPTHLFAAAAAYFDLGQSRESPRQLTKSSAGRAFFDFFGESLLRSDLSISVGELGSLLDHSGPIGEGERYAARVFGAYRSYTVTNGTSTSNRVVLMAIVTRDLRCAPPVGRQKQENADESVSPSHYRPANRERQS